MTSGDRWKTKLSMQVQTGTRYPDRDSDVCSGVRLGSPSFRRIYIKGDADATLDGITLGVITGSTENLATQYMHLS